MPRTSGPNLWLRLPLWVRWAISGVIAVIVIVALILFVDRHNNNDLATLSPAANARANREAEIVVSQDQAPHVLKLKAGVAGKQAFTKAIRAAMTQLLAKGQIDGPFDRVSCRHTGSSPGHTRYACTGKADDVNYPFVGVIDERAGQITYCKRDPPPVPSENIPLSPRCLR
ncbi:MAG: hypothetical protein WAK93_02770 [Solirubrobacteraceae bacterium]